VAYQLKLQEDSNVYPVFHASLLKSLKNLKTDSLKLNQKRLWILEGMTKVKWRGLLQFEELSDKLRREFPGFLLEGKLW
jgi:hypothetical protein